MSLLHDKVVSYVISSYVMSSYAQTIAPVMNINDVSV